MSNRSEINAIPNHVAIIMDGNGRWAELRGEQRNRGHRQGVKSVKRIVKACIERGIKVLTLFAFSSENWKRPSTEVSLLMDLFLSVLGSELRGLDENGVSLRFIGDRSGIPPSVQRAMENTETGTAAHNKLTLVIAVGYGGQWDIKHAMRQLARRVEAGELSPREITEAHITDNLSTVDTPPPDLFIRTGGERRISNFLLWQLAYTELYFTDTLWPDFNELAFDVALEDYAKRQRRYGMTSTQIMARQISHA